jgi:hypothetical protein
LVETGIDTQDEVLILNQKSKHDPLIKSSKQVAKQTDEKADEKYSILENSSFNERKIFGRLTIGSWTPGIDFKRQLVNRRIPSYIPITRLISGSKGGARSSIPLACSIPVNTQSESPGSIPATGVSIRQKQRISTRGVNFERINLESAICCKVDVNRLDPNGPDIQPVPNMDAFFSGG